jgi:adenylate cyclase class IV
LSQRHDVTKGFGPGNMPSVISYKNSIMHNRQSMINSLEIFNFDSTKTNSLMTKASFRPQPNKRRSRVVPYVK